LTSCTLLTIRHIPYYVPFGPGGTEICPDQYGYVPRGHMSSGKNFVQRDSQVLGENPQVGWERQAIFLGAEKGLEGT